MIIPSKLLRAALSAMGALLCMNAAVGQTEAVVLKRPAELREAPGETGRSLAALPVQTPVTRLGERQGAWVKVRTNEGTTGWLHMFDVVPTQGAAGNSTSNAGSSALRGITSFFNKGSAQASSTTLATSTVGIRGLGAEDLANSQPNMAAVSQADANRVDANQARQFGNTALLSPRSVAALPEAPRAAPSNGGAQPFNGSGSY